MKSTKFFIDQHGCAKNQVDGEILISHLTSTNGWIQTFDPAQADLIIVNSCGFIESAKAECLNAVLSARKDYPNAKILLAGCLAERYAKDLDKSLPEADGFFGNGELSNVVQTAKAVMENKRPVHKFAQKGVCGAQRNLLLSFAGTAFVKITEGCNNRCSFCAIPLIRGELRSRLATEIIEEIKELVAKGIYEINLIGQDLAAYGTGSEDNVFGNGRTYLPNGTPGSDAFLEQSKAGESGLCALLKMISSIDGEFRLRLLYIHPDHFNEDILPVIKNDERILPYFDIPFQSGDDRIISQMHRTGNRKDYIGIIEKIRSYFPEAAIRTTFLAGFPGETQDEAQNTLDFLSAARTDWSGCFPYSREDDTPAYDFKKQVPHKTALLRSQKLVATQEKITEERLKSRTGKDYDVLIEEVLSKNEDSPNEGIAIGRAWFQAPEVDGSVVVNFDRSNPKELEAVRAGRLVRVHINSAGSVDLNGDFVADSPLNKKIKQPKLEFAQEISG
ncbi:30S ribosomal protein S12 methylthiotransferase RimO [Treponema pectinovorum]|uniref:30S ribosomal protein S12 methylthiotransferase RimO n=1 Tax=Treponema pectinovorum TaxID=164 RepID=UPI0011CCA5E0|nr:30S ribosomal protein S12 methylthiotransferase RimO [Treponema pectinovorum]